MGCSPSPSRVEAGHQLWGQGGGELGLGQGPWEQRELRKGSEGQGPAWSIWMRGWGQFQLSIRHLKVRHWGDLTEKRPVPFLLGLRG